MKLADKDTYLAPENEDFNKSGICTSGFWARWMLWHLPTVEASIRDVKKIFNINVKLYKHTPHRKDRGTDIYDHTYKAVVF